MDAINKLANRNILVIGGTSGIGFAVAKQALQSGADITITSSSAVKVSEAFNHLRSLVPNRESAVRSYVADLSAKNKLEETVESLLKFTAVSRPIDHIVFTAGNFPHLPPLDQSTIQDVDAFFIVRLYGAMAVGKYAPKYMISNKSSLITFTTGIQGDKPLFWLPPAVAGAVEGLMKGLAVTLSPLRVNAVSPGFVWTELTQGFLKKEPKGSIERYKSQSLLKDVGYPEEVAEAYLYLLRDSFVTGSTVATNGGALLI